MVCVPSFVLYAQVLKRSLNLPCLSPFSGKIHGYSQIVLTFLVLLAPVPFLQTLLTSFQYFQSTQAVHLILGMVETGIQPLAHLLYRDQP